MNFRALMFVATCALSSLAESATEKTGAAAVAATSATSTAAPAATAPKAVISPSPIKPAMARRLASVPLLYGHFVQAKAIKGLNKPLTSRGDFLVAKDRGVIWRTQQPFNAAVAVTPKGIWSIKGGGAGLDPKEEAAGPKRSPVHQGNLGATMGMIQKVMAGDAADLGKAFKVAEAGTDSAWTLRLEPKDAVMARFIKSVSLKGSAHVDVVEYLEANGDSTHIAFSEVAEGGGALSGWVAPILRD